MKYAVEMGSGAMIGSGIEKLMGRGCVFTDTQTAR
jgi:hypothetical protein